MATWNAPLPKDGEEIVAGDPGHPGMHNAMVAVAEEIRVNVDAIPAAPTADTLTGATATGKLLMKATNAAAALSAIGGGTSSLALGATASTAAAGNHAHAFSAITGTATVTQLPRTAAPATLTKTAVASVAVPTKAEFDAVVADLTTIVAAYNTLVTSLKAGVLS